MDRFKSSSSLPGIYSPLLFFQTSRSINKVLVCLYEISYKQYLCVVLVVQMKKKLEGGVIGISALLRVPIPKPGILEVLDLRRGSIVAPPRLLVIGK